MALEKLIIFASGTKDGGASGLGKLIEARDSGALQAVLVAVVSNHELGGAYQKAKKAGIPFVHFTKPWAKEGYQAIIKEYGATFTALSGWLKLVAGLNSETTFNIHPGPLPKFGGSGMYGHFVHEAVLAAYQRGEIRFSEISMHFVTEPKTKDDYDKGPVFFRMKVPIEATDTPETLGKRANVLEHEWQSRITNLVVNKAISWDGKNPDSLIIPDQYHFHLPLS